MEGGSSAAPVSVPPLGAVGQTAAPAEGAIDKYKRLLSLARSSLEANQATLASKDAQIAELAHSVEELRRTQHAQRGVSRGFDDALEAASIPRSLLRRVDADDLIWILVEFEGSDDGWICFNSDSELSDYIQRVQGVPLVSPARSLTPAESQKIVCDAQAKVDQIVEEFRRFKLRTDIARKQRDAETRQALMLTTSPAAPGSLGAGTGGAVSSSSSSYGGINGKGSRTSAGTEAGEESAGAQPDSETRWRTAYEQVVRENEQLRNRGGDMMLANQWRERYDSLLRERDDLTEKLRVFTKMDSGGGSGVGGGRSLEQAYLDLKDEYKEFRWRMTSREQQRQLEIEDLRVALAGKGTSSPNSTSSTTLAAGGDSSGSLHSMGMLGTSSERGGSGVGSGGLGESKHQYIRHMLLQYLSCREPEVKQHIEHALLAMFRFSEAERALIEERKKSEEISIIEDLSLTNVANFLSSQLLGANARQQP